MPRRDLLRSAPVRVLVSVAVALLVAGLLVWWSPDRLPAPNPIVGRPTFKDTDYQPSYLAYRVVVWQIPLVAAIVYLLLRRLTGEARALEEPTAIPDPPPVSPAPGRVVGAVSRVAVVGLLVAIAASSEGDPSAHLGLVGSAAGILYVGVLVASSRPDRPGGGWLERLSLVHPLVAPTVVALCVWWFARHTTTVSGERRDVWPWLPWWVALAGAALGTAWVLHRRRRSAPGAGHLESSVLTWGAGSALIFVASAKMLPSPWVVLGFDDMMGVTGAQMLREGAVPWRDVLMIHGPFDDGLRQLVGFALFEPTVWGAAQAEVGLWAPLCWVGLYLLAIWALPRRGALAVAMFVVVLLLALLVPTSVRWVLAAPVFVLLGAALRRRSVAWSAALTVALFVEAVLVPEASFQVIAAAVVLVAADLHERRTGGWAGRFPPRTSVFAAVGAGCTVLLLLVLLPLGAIDDFLRYYVVFGPGHAAAGALPIPEFVGVVVLLAFMACALLVGATVVWAITTLTRRRGILPEEWLLVAAAVLAGLYGEKALGRFDDAHAFQSIQMTLPLVVLWLARLLPRADRALRPVAARRLPAASRAATASLASVTVVALALVTVRVPAALWSAPRHDAALVSPVSYPGLGYVQPGRFDADAPRDLRRVVAALGGARASVFDFSNSPGIVYFLAGFRSPTPYYHVSMAIPEVAQRQVIEQLARSRPDVVTFDATRFGLSSWDGVTNAVRHFLVSRYLLDHYTPVLRSHGVLFMVRDDLASRTSFELPRLSEQPVTSGLYGSVVPCSWGYVPSFLPSEPRGERRSARVDGWRDARQLFFKGWAWNGTGAQQVAQVVVAIDGEVVGRLGQDSPRFDPLIEGLTPVEGLGSGVKSSVVTTRTGRPQVYAILANGSAHPLSALAADAPTQLDLGGGTTAPVRRTPVPGKIRLTSEREVRTADVSLPTGATSSALATFRSSSGPLGPTSIALYDAPATPSSASMISFSVRSGSTRTAGVRVGSCPQWHGWSSNSLQLVQSGGRPVTSVTFSDVADPGS